MDEIVLMQVKVLWIILADNIIRADGTKRPRNMRFYGRKKMDVNILKSLIHEKVKSTVD